MILDEIENHIATNQRQKLGIQLLRLFSDFLAANRLEAWCAVCEAVIFEDTHIAGEDEVFKDDAGDHLLALTYNFMTSDFYAAHNLQRARRDYLNITHLAGNYGISLPALDDQAFNY